MAKTQLAEAKQTIADGESQLAEAKQTIADGETQLADAKQEIADGKISLADVKQEIADKEKELEDSKAEYEKAKADAEPEIADAKQEIADGEKTLADLKKPTWYVWGRNKVTSTESFGQDAGRISNIGKILPGYLLPRGCSRQPDDDDTNDRGTASADRNVKSPRLFRRRDRL